jgi:SET domain
MKVVLCTLFNLGYGVFAKENIEANTFLFEYQGHLVTKEEGLKILSSSSGPGYLFFFGKNNWYALNC